VGQGKDDHRTNPDTTVSIVSSGTAPKDAARRSEG
jgi:hypothetical protein